MQNFNFTYSKKPITLLIFLYTLSHGLILLNRGVFWDDWTLFNVDKKIIKATFYENGLPWIGYFHSFMFSFDMSIILYRGIVYLAYLFSAVFLYGILKNIKEINNTERLLIAVIFAIFPVNSARIALIDVPYAISYFLFFFGFWLTTIYLVNKNILLRILALTVFFISFSTNSLLVFYSILFLYIFYVERQATSSRNLVIKKIISYSDYLFLPLIFWVIKNVFFKPFGLYKNYNQLTIESIALAPAKSILSFYTSFIQVISRSITGWLVILTLAGLMSVVLLFQKKVESTSDKKNNFRLLLFGFFAFFIGVFPYAAVGHILQLNDWSSRHQLLVPLGASFIIVFGIKVIIKKDPARNFAFAALIVLFLFSNIANYVALQKDWYKQLSLIQNFKMSKKIRNNTTFLFDDRTRSLNANGRSYRFYEYTGIMKAAFLDETRFGKDYMARRPSLELNELRPFLTGRYNIGGYIPKGEAYKVRLEPGNYNLNNDVNFIKLIFQENIDPNKFKENTKRIIKLRITKF